MAKLNLETYTPIQIELSPIEVELLLRVLSLPPIGIKTFDFAKDSVITRLTDAKIAAINKENNNQLDKLVVPIPY